MSGKAAPAKKRKAPTRKRRKPSADLEVARPGPRISDAEHKRRKRVAVAIANPVFFGEHYIRPLDENWNNDLPAVAQSMLGFAKSVRRGVLMTPPEFLKTTMVSQVYPLWLTYRYAAVGKIGLLTGMLMSEEQALAEGNLSVIAWHIEHNRRLADDFIDRSGRPLVEPDPDEDKWTDSELIVRRPGVSKDATWEAKGLNSQGIQGSRVRHLIADDLVTPASGRSPAKQKAAKHLWDTTITTRVFEEGQAIIAGNYNHAKDLLSDLASRTSYQLMRRPNLHVPGDPSKPPISPRDRDAVLALPERWSRVRLLTDLAEKPASFAQIHLLRSGTEGGEKLKTSWVTRIALSDIPRLHRSYLIAIDPAPGSEDAPDPSYFSITAACMTAKHLDVVESYADRLESTEQVDVLARFVERYSTLGHLRGIAIAKIALDRYFKGAALVGHPELRPLFHEVSILQGESAKTERLSYLGTYAKSGWLRITENAWMSQTASVDHREQEESLAEQWEAFPNQNHDDRLDSLDVLIRDARELGGQTTVVSSEGTGNSFTGDLHTKEM